MMTDRGRTDSEMHATRKFAVNIEMWYRGDFVSRIEQAHAQGFGAIEFWLPDDKALEAGAARLRELGMVVTQFTAWPFCKELNDSAQGAGNFLVAMERACEIAGMFPGCGMFTVVLGDDVLGLSRGEMHAAAVEKLKLAVPILEREGMTAIVEPMNPYDHPAHCFYGSAEGVAVCEAVGSPRVKLNYDLFHMQRFEGNLIANLRKAKEWIGYVQLADSPDRHEPGTGEVNYAAVLATLDEIGYEGYVGLECLPKDGDVQGAARRVRNLLGDNGS